METTSHESIIKIPFYHNDRKGLAMVSYGRNEDPVQAGFDNLAELSNDSLTALGFDINLTIGYPTMQAWIENYEGTGYRTILGWIQVVTDKYCDSYGSENDPVELEVSVDRLQPFQNLELPFFAYGNLPQAFDAPCLNLTQHTQLKWIADTFLTTVPVRSRDEEISWLLGFRWGYIEYDTQEERPVVLLPLEITHEGDWNAHLPLLRDQFPNWRFGKAGSS
ncbi:MAG: hypothetical protein JW762_06555 [Dehalococcoidales bacterium]|nr:hypothetical protein [Dehalococcoidales bacterium]